MANTLRLPPTKAADVQAKLSRFSPPATAQPPKAPPAPPPAGQPGESKKLGRYKAWKAKKAAQRAETRAAQAAAAAKRKELTNEQKRLGWLAATKANNDKQAEAKAERRAKRARRHITRNRVRQSEARERRRAPGVAVRMAMFHGFPEVFSASPKPLALGIHLQLVEATGLPMHDIRAFLRFWVSDPVYLRAVIAGTQRYNLDGSPAGEISEQNRADARAHLQAVLPFLADQQGTAPAA